MSSGQKNVTINTQERALSTDINRLQAFNGATIAEIFRSLMNGTGDADLNAGVTADHSTLETPLRAEIFGGLMCRPQSGNTDVFVDPGLLFCVVPGGTGDDSPYKFSRSAGVNTAGVLTIAGNASGSIRIDVVECEWVDTIVETDNRDIFDPTTGLFSAVNVTKAREGRLNFRVRQGVAGAGIPANQNGWLPLMVASVPNGSVNNDTVTFWDVRPLIADREYGLSALTNHRPIVRKSSFNAIDPAVAGGWFELIHEGRRLGGALRTGGVAADLGTDPAINLTSADNQAAGFVPLASVPYYIWIVTPHGLPRWARYTNTGGRVPRSPCGIPVVSTIPPDIEGRPSLQIPLPTSTGLAVSTFSGVAVTAGYMTAASVLGGFWANNGEHQMVANTPDILTDPIVRPSTSRNVAAGVLTVRYDLSAGFHYPTNAKKILLEVRSFITSSNAAFAKTTAKTRLDMYAPGTNTRITQMYIGSFIDTHTGPAGIDTNVEVITHFWVNLPSVYPFVVGPANRLELVFENGTTITACVSSHARVMGWEL